MGTWLSRPVAPVYTGIPQADRSSVSARRELPFKNYLLQAVGTVRGCDWPSEDKNNTENPHLLLVLCLLGLLSPGYIFKCFIFWSILNLGLSDLRCKENVPPPPTPQIIFPPCFPKESKTIQGCSPMAFTYSEAVKRTWRRNVSGGMEARSRR